jgi:hypothetical protein
VDSKLKALWSSMLGSGTWWSKGSMGSAADLIEGRVDTMDANEIY